jgi:hypothetical protein
MRGERNKARKNPNPEKQKNRDHQTGKKLPSKPPEKQRPPEPPIVNPRGKKIIDPENS